MKNRLLEEAILALKNHSQTPQLDAELLLCWILGETRIALWTQNLTLTPEQEKLFFDLVMRRAEGEPLAYLIGEKAFWNFRLKVTPNTLIPREETELLVRLSLGVLNKEDTATILELGTGSGAIALALASELQQAQVVAVEKSLAALEVAKENAQALNISNIRFVQSDWFSALPLSSYDLIVSNPPYIAYDDLALSPSVKQYEPSSAYFAEDNGLADIKHIVNLAPAYLKSGGHLLIEHGYLQGEVVREILRKAQFVEVQTYQDEAGLDRVTGGIVNL